MDSMYTRTSLVLGEKGLEDVKKSNVLIFGTGGVGSYAAEALVRSGVGNITIVDFDDVDVTNINRQLPALHSTVGMRKVDILKDRYKDINPELEIEAVALKLDESTIDKFDLKKYDYVIDAIDMISSKLLLIEACHRDDVRIISSMGMGFRIDPTKVEIMDIFKTSNDPLARIMRKELRNRNIRKLKVVCSTELPIKTAKETGGVTASIAFVPAAAGLAIASTVIREIAGV